jgi:hypothetical protein
MTAAKKKVESPEDVPPVESAGPLEVPSALGDTFAKRAAARKAIQAAENKSVKAAEKK